MQRKRTGNILLSSYENATAYGETCLHCRPRCPIENCLQRPYHEDVFRFFQTLTSVCLLWIAIKVKWKESSLELPCVLRLPSHSTYAAAKARPALRTASLWAGGFGALWNSDSAGGARVGQRPVASFNSSVVDASAKFCSVGCHH